MNKKLLTANQLKRLAQGLDSRIDSAVLKENTRATKEETRLETKINDTTEMLGGKSFVYLTSVEYESLSDADKNDESKVYIITDAEDVSHSHDNKDFLDKLSDERVLILIETIILKSSGNKLYEISITPDGNLRTELITSGTEEEIILKDQFDTLFKLSVNDSGALYLEETTEGEYKHIYIQAKYPYAEIFRLGVYTDNEGSVIVASSLNQNFIKDTGAYNNYTWSSIKILEEINKAKESVFQSGANTKQQLVDVLSAKGVSTVSASNSWTDIINVISSPYFMYKTEEWYVEDVSGATYNFVLNSNGYYESTNKEKDNSYALCKLIIFNHAAKNVTMKYINSGEQGLDFGIVSKLNKTLELSSYADSDCLLKCSESSPEEETLPLGRVEGFYYIKYRKDNSTHAGNDSFQFRIIFD